QKVALSQNTPIVSQQISTFLYIATARIIITLTSNLIALIFLL
ncbi:14866_t:CDS:1, partial [Funneliformis mosseae]